MRHFQKQLAFFILALLAPASVAFAQSATTVHAVAKVPNASNHLVLEVTGSSFTSSTIPLLNSFRSSATEKLSTGMVYAADNVFGNPPSELRLLGPNTQSGQGVSIDVPSGPNPYLTIERINSSSFALIDNQGIVSSWTPSLTAPIPVLTLPQNTGRNYHTFSLATDEILFTDLSGPFGTNVGFYNFVTGAERTFSPILGNVGMAEATENGFIVLTTYQYPSPTQYLERILMYHPTWQTFFEHSNRVFTQTSGTLTTAFDLSENFVFVRAERNNTTGVSSIITEDLLTSSTTTANLGTMTVQALSIQ